MSLPSLPIGTRLVLVDPEPPVTAPVDGHQGTKPYETGYRACSTCSACTGLPEGTDSPWSLIDVRAWDSTVGELIVAPVVFSNVSSPRRVHVEDLLDLYDVQSEGTVPDGWTTPIEEIV